MWSVAPPSSLDLAFFLELSDEKSAHPHKWLSGHES